MRHALRWLDELVGSYPRCEFHFVQGNHDCNRRFIRLAQGYTATRRNLAVHPYLFRQGGKSCSCTATRPTTRPCVPTRLTHRREHWSHDESRSQVRHVLYDLAVTARLHRLAGKVAHPRRRVAHRILGYLSRVHHGPESGVEHVYFGHTHDALENYQLSRFHLSQPRCPDAGAQFSDCGSEGVGTVNAHFVYRRKSKQTTSLSSRR